MVTAERRTYSFTERAPLPRPADIESKEKQPFDPEWTISLNGYDQTKQRASEVINSLANGYMGFRASVAGSREGVHQPATYIAGLYEKIPTRDGEKIDQTKVPDLVHIPDFLHLDFHNGQEWYDKDGNSNLLSYSSNLDMKSGNLVYKYRWQDSTGKITKVEHTKFLSQADEHVGGLQFKITPENYSGIVTIKTGIDGNVDNKGTKFLVPQERGETESGDIYYKAKTRYKGSTIALASRVNVVADKQVRVSKETIYDEQGISQQVQFQAEAGQTYSLDKVVAVYSSRDKVVDPARAAVVKVGDSASLEQLVADNSEKWKENWDSMDIEIKGDEKAQRDTRYNLFKLRQLAQDKDKSVSIAAKGLDNLPGEGYMGHIFWDTEIFMLPFFTHTNPEIAKSLLMYRYNTLPAAREKAKEHGYEGALFPWESADTGEEATPEWAHDLEGRAVRIHTGEREYHISADVAYATWEYFKATNDYEFLRNYGAEIISETARFWASKAEYNEKKDRYEIKRVIGPDEYHEKGPDGNVGVDNNFFNNSMARWNIQKAIDIWNVTSEDSGVQEKMGLTPAEVEKWNNIAEKIYIPFDPNTGVYSQFDGYFDLEDIDLASQYPGVTAMDSQLRNEGKEPTQYKVIKQADVLMGIELLKEKNPDVVKANYEYYEPRCSHGSSLSDASHVVLDVKVGEMDKAYSHLQKAMTIDLNDTKLNNHFGTHAAALGGTWKAIVYGFGGVEMNDDSLSIAPHLPYQWDGLSFNMQYKGNKIHAEIDRENVSLSLTESNNAIPFKTVINGTEYNLEPGGNYRFKTSLEERRMEVNKEIIFTA